MPFSSAVLCHNTEVWNSMTDTGRIRMEPYQGVLYCEAYMEDEFSVTDLDAMRAEIRKDYNDYADVILKKAGNYSVALDAQRILSRNIDEFRHFVYIVDSDVKRASAEFAAGSYMESYKTQIATTLEEALTLLKALEHNG
jgi:hypothetical protein